MIISMEVLCSRQASF